MLATQLVISSPRAHSRRTAAGCQYFAFLCFEQWAEETPLSLQIAHVQLMLAERLFCYGFFCFSGFFFQQIFRTLLRCDRSEAVFPMNDRNSPPSQLPTSYSKSKMLDNFYKLGVRIHVYNCFYCFYQINISYA